MRYLVQLLPKKSFDTDAYVLACVPHARLMCAGQVGISEPTKPGRWQGFAR